MAIHRRKSLRHALLDADSSMSDVAEGLRDLQQANAQLPTMRAIEYTRYVWAPPFFLSANSQPIAVLLGRSRESTGVAYGAAAFVGWTFTSQGVRIDSVPSLTVGMAYDLTFLLIGG